MNSEPTPHIEEDHFATIGDARLAVERLTDGNYATLLAIAAGFCRTRLRGGNVVQPEDLLHDAISKTLDGERRWNREVSILKHLDRTMESDSGHIAAQRSKWPMRPLPTADADELAAGHPAVDSRLEARDEFERALDLFVDDKDALDLLRLKARGYAASEIQRELGIGKMQYETTTTRIRRHLAKHLASGGR